MSGAFVAYEIDRSQLDPRFISYYFKITSVWKSIGSQSTGTNIRRRSLHPDQFEAAKIPLPPLDEQRRIVARIGQLAAKIQEARSLRHEAAEQGEAVVRTTARKLLGQVDAPLTPLASWVDTSCDAIQTGPFGAQLSSSDFVESGLPLLTIGNVQFGGLDRAGLKYVTKEKAKQLSRYRVIEGDILLARMGTVGRCCIVPADADGWLINYHIIRVRLDRARVDPPYIHWIIQASGDVESYLEEKIRGATRQGVNSSIVGNIPCRVALLPEQRRIVAYLDDLQAKADGLKKLQAETAAELDSLLPSILDEAFKGEL
jgi:type I restriction enzyme S subunit